MQKALAQLVRPLLQYSITPLLRSDHARLRSPSWRNSDVCARRTGATDCAEPAGTGERTASHHSSSAVRRSGLSFCAAGWERPVRHRAMDRGCDARFGQRATGPDANERCAMRADRHAVERARHTNTSHRHMNVDFPYHFDARGRTAEIDYDSHIRDLIEQVLFTAPGERVNRPDFGSGLLRLVFAPNSTELAATTQYLVQGSLQQYLGDLIQVDSVDVTSEDSTLRVSVRYLVRQTQTLQSAEFTKGVPTA